MPCPEVKKPLKRKKKKKDNPKKKHRKHTPITSEAQRKAMAVAEFSPEKAYGAAKQIAEGMTKAELKRHRKEAEGKKLPAKAKLKRKKK